MKVKNISNRNLVIPGVGLVKSGEEAVVPKEFHNANFEEVKSAPKTEPKTEPKKEEPKVDTSNNKE